jgi:hypothetical protein
MRSFAASVHDSMRQMNSKLTRKGSGTKLASAIAENALWSSTTGRVSLCFFKIGKRG